MRLQQDNTAHGDFRWPALASALAAIPVPFRVKKRIVSPDGRRVVIEREAIRDITFEEMIARMEKVEPSQGRHREQLIATLVVLESIGIVTLESPSSTVQPGLEGVRISATSEPAGYLLQSLSKFMTTVPHQKSPIRSDSNIKSFRSVIGAALRNNKLNPHLVLANLLERGRENAAKDPLRRVRVISVLIKGERVKADSTRETESVYLHVKKPDWDSYALIGSAQGEGERDEETARLALEEDLETLADMFDLKPSGIEDEHDTELTITRGVYTHYTFNLFTVEALHDELRLLDDLEYAWFTFEEICNGKSRMGHTIMTRAGLLKRINEDRGLGSIPAVVINPKPFLAKSIRSQARDVVREFKDVVREAGELAQLAWRRLLSVKWWLVLLLGIIGFSVLIRPIINRSIPTLSNIADILGIIGFILSLGGIFADLRRQSRRRSR